MKSSQSNFNLRSPGSYLVRSYLITTVIIEGIPRFGFSKNTAHKSQTCWPKDSNLTYFFILTLYEYQNFVRDNGKLVSWKFLLNLGLANSYLVTSLLLFRLGKVLDS